PGGHPAAQVQAEGDHQDTGHHGGPDGVHVEQEAAEIAGDVVADLDLAHRVGRLGHDRNSLRNGAGAPPIMMSWNTARPAITPSPSGRTASAQPTATRVITPSRVSTDMVNRRRRCAASLAAYCTTERCTASVLSAPRPSPSSPNSPITGCPVRVSTT